MGVLASHLWTPNVAIRTCSADLIWSVCAGHLEADQSRAGAKLDSVGWRRPDRLGGHFKHIVRVSAATPTCRKIEPGSNGAGEDNQRTGGAAAVMQSLC